MGSDIEEVKNFVIRFPDGQEIFFNKDSILEVVDDDFMFYNQKGEVL